MQSWIWWSALARALLKKFVLYWLSNRPDDLAVNFETLTYADKSYNNEEVKDLSTWVNNITSGEYIDYYL